MKLLLVEDDRALCDVVRRGLSENGHVIDIEHDGAGGLKTARTERFDAIILDVMLPHVDGLQVARELRAAKVRTPILMLTARDTVEDIITGLDAGADDYLRKPFAFGELEARLRSIARRENAPQRGELCVANLRMDLGTRRAFRQGREIALSAREIAFLEYFMRNEGLLVTRAMLENALWETDRDTTSNVIEVYVRRLRAKLSPAGEAQLLHTVRGAGYRFGLEG
ncbi:MAG: DNA-binding response regulator [Candidatus Meridianibacter frigidus]|nr:MAG: DNA-binding response regulator [Candidatus Eremiobacteraeota bacterium]